MFWYVYLVKHAWAKASQERFERYERSADDADVDFDGGPCDGLDAGIWFRISIDVKGP